ncbi:MULTISPECIES: ABC transporter substrate-binding protein [Acutalibacteraceae]|uniref:ABC transporter substrate-binding protein n=1 Tax=Acutalibacteraceae TaxID=3082771 RepID=UPI0013E8BB02|nr:MULTISPECIES: ABC transporter substrate-binding protein [Acutalibacteraceae]
MKRRLILLVATFLLLLLTGATLRRTSTVDAVSGATKLKKLKESAITNSSLPGLEAELKGSELKIAGPSFPSDLDPAHGNGCYTLAYGVGETLFYINNGDIQPWLAQSWRNLGPRTWEIKLSPGVKFQNDKTMTAQSVKESLERAVRLDTDAAKLLPVSFVQAEGLTLTIHTSAPCPSLIHNLAAPAFTIVDAASDQKESFSYFPVCTGPFIPTTFIGQVEVVLRRFDDYHGGTPKLGGADIRLVADTDKLVQNLKNRTTDAAVGLPQEDISTLSKSGCQIETKDTACVELLMMNQQNAALSNSAVRQAVALAISRQAAGGAFAPALPYMDHTDPYPYDPAAAKTLLAQAGYAGETLSFRLALPAGDAELLKRAQTIKTQLGQVGIDITVRIYNDVFFTSRARYGKFDLLLMTAQTAENGDAQNFFESYVASEGNLNYGHYRNEQVDADLAQLEREFDSNRRVLLTDQIQSLVVKDAAFVFLGYPQTDVVASKSVSGLPVSSAGYRLTADTSKK